MTSGDMDLLDRAAGAKRIRQHIGWLAMYAEMMDETNWRDMKLRIERQARELSEDFRALLQSLEGERS